MVSFSRIAVIARNVFLEVIRDRILYVLALFAIVMVVAIALLPEVAAGTEDKLLLDLGLGAINLFTLVVTIVVGTGLVNKEIEKKTVLVLIAKPVGRFDIILGKHLGLAALVATLMVAQTAIFFTLLALKGAAIPALSLLLALGFMYLEMLLMVAVTLLFGVFTSSLLATLLSFGTYLVGHLSTDLLNLSQLGESVGFQRVVEGLYLVLPNLERLNLKNEAVYGLALLPNAGQLALNALYGLIYTALLLTLASNIFARRQF